MHTSQNKLHMDSKNGLIQNFNKRAVCEGSFFMIYMDVVGHLMLLQSFYH